MDDWEERVDPSSGRKFYINHRTREVTGTALIITAWILKASAVALFRAPPPPLLDIVSATALTT